MTKLGKAGFAQRAEEITAEDRQKKAEAIQKLLSRSAVVSSAYCAKLQGHPGLARDRTSPRLGEWIRPFVFACINTTTAPFAFPSSSRGATPALGMTSCTCTWA